MQVLYEEGYTNVKQHRASARTPTSSMGRDGSLDHILANDAAMDDSPAPTCGTSTQVSRSRWSTAVRTTTRLTSTPLTCSARRTTTRRSWVWTSPWTRSTRRTEPATTTVTATGGEFGYDEDIVIPVDVDSANPTTGTVEIRDGDTVLGSTTLATDGTGTVTIEAGTLEVGTHTLTVRYSGDANNNPSTSSVEVSVVKASCPGLGRCEPVRGRGRPGHHDRDRRGRR